MNKEVPFAETFPPPQKHITLSRAILLLFLFPAVATEGLKLRDHVQLGKEVFLILCSKQQPQPSESSAEAAGPIACSRSQTLRANLSVDVEICPSRGTPRQNLPFPLLPSPKGGFSYLPRFRDQFFPLSCTSLLLLRLEGGTCVFL